MLTEASCALPLPLCNTISDVAVDRQEEGADRADESGAQDQLGRPRQDHTRAGMDGPGVLRRVQEVHVCMYVCERINDILFLNLIYL